MDKIEKFRGILQQYADKGHERFNNALDKYEEGERSDEFYWDGYSDCAESLLKIYDSMQKEPQVRKYKCLRDYYPFGEPRSYTAGKIYDVLRDDQGIEWITNDNGHSELFGYFSKYFELVEEPESKLEEIPPIFPQISQEEKSTNEYLEEEVIAFRKEHGKEVKCGLGDLYKIANHFVSWYYNLLDNKAKKFMEGKTVLSINLDGEPVSDDLEKSVDAYLATYFGDEREKEDWPFLKKMAIHFAMWGMNKQRRMDANLGSPDYERGFVNGREFERDLIREPKNEDLEKELKRYLCSEEYDKAVGSGSSLIARHFAQWQKEQLMKKTCEFLYDQLNNGDMECGDIEKFIEKFKNKIEE